MSKLQTKIQKARRMAWGIMRIGKYDCETFKEVMGMNDGYYVYCMFGSVGPQGPFTKRQAANLAYHYSLGR